MPPITIMIKPVSGQCNMRCRYCFYADELRYRAEGMGKRMTPDTLEKAVRRVLRSADSAVQFVFQGGEPTLAGLPFFEGLIRFQRMYGRAGLAVSNALQTNGLELSDEMIAFLARERFLVGVSLDGDALIHDQNRLDARGEGTYSRVKANLDRLIQAGAECNVLCVVTREAAARPEKVFEALRPYSWLQFIPCLDPLDGAQMPCSLSGEDYARFLCRIFDLYERAFYDEKPVSVRTFDNWLALLLDRPPDSCAMCGQCGDSLMMEWDGSLYPCDFYGTDEWYLGNITETSFQKILSSPLEKKFRDRSRPVPASCRACPWYALCRNGCQRERGQDQVQRWCGAYRRFFEYAYPRLRAMAERLAVSRDQADIHGKAGAQP